MFVVGYPKSGNTWLCYLLAYCLNSEFDDFDVPGVYPLDLQLRKKVKGGLLHQSYSKELGKVLKTHGGAENIPTNNRPIVYLLRDGRDVIVSYYHYEYGYKRQLPLWDKRLALRTRVHLLRWKITSSFFKPSFSMYVRRRSIEWARHVRGWKARGWDSMICYEDLRTDTPSAIEKLILSFGIKVPLQIIDEAVELFSFNKLSGRAKEEERRTSFYRKGKIGDWKNFFGIAEQKIFLEQAHDVMDEFGYGIGLTAEN